MIVTAITKVVLIYMKKISDIQYTGPLGEITKIYQNWSYIVQNKDIEIHKITDSKIGKVLSVYVDSNSIFTIEKDIGQIRDRINKFLGKSYLSKIVTKHK